MLTSACAWSVKPLDLPQHPTREVLNMTMAATITQVPVKVDSEKCIAEKGCTVCVDVCPLDVLAIDHVTGKAFMKFDECWYCLPCEKDCPTGAVHVDIPFLLR